MLFVHDIQHMLLELEFRKHLLDNRNEKEKQKMDTIISLDKILQKSDHTLLRQDATWNEIKETIDDGIRYNTASVCIPPAYVSEAANYIHDKKSSLKVCTVIGFPNGYHTTAVKRFETEDAIKNGADEIDMVIHLGWLKDKKYDAILDEIKEIKKVCGAKLLKVIIETCLLNEDEIIKMCEIVSKSGAEYIKTSTGFSIGGATFNDVKLMSEHISEGVMIKAAGGISSLEDAKKFIELGASRLGTSRIVKIAKEQLN